jgi:membrane fusion protein, heavy metal efflux system
VPEADVLGVDVGEQAIISSPALQDRTLTGTVEHVADVVDSTRRMVNVRVRVPNTDHALRANAFVQVAFRTGGMPRVHVATEAVVTDDQQSFVFVQTSTPPAHLERRPVVPGRQHDGTVEILRGLAPGETYVSEGAILLLNAVDLAR